MERKKSIQDEEKRHERANGKNARSVYLSRLFEQAKSAQTAGKSEAGKSGKLGRPERVRFNFD